METMEIILLIAGGIIFILSFFIPEKQGRVSENSRKIMKDEIAVLLEKEMEGVRGNVDVAVEEAVAGAMEKTERSLERLSNEKIMAVNEYSDTVLAEIHKDHEEAVFLYDMLNSKHASLKNTVSEVNRAVKEAEKTIASFRKAGSEAVPAAEPKAVPAAERKVVERGLDRIRRAGELKTAEVPQKPKKESDPTGAGENGKISAQQAKEISMQNNGGEENPVKNSNEKILELYNQGKSKTAIARELGLGVGEVKLVIDLFKGQ